MKLGRDFLTTKNRLGGLKENIGKRCRVLDSVVAGLAGKEATIIDVLGNDFDGYRYTIELDEPIFSFKKQIIYYPVVFNVKILN